MTMEVGAEAQQGADTAVAETEAQQITQAQIATLTQVTMSSQLGYVAVSGKHRATAHHVNGSGREFP